MPYSIFDPDRLAWLKWKAEKNQHVSAKDVARIVCLNPELVPDEMLRDFIVRGLRGELKKPAGRRPHSVGQIVKLVLADEMVKDEIARLKQEEKAGRLSSRSAGDPTLREQAYDTIGRNLHMSGRSLANAISALKSRLGFRD